MTVRKAHVKRVYGKIEGEIDKEVWVDIYRIDEYDDMSNAGGEGQVRHLKWLDGPNDGNPNDSGNTARQTTKKQITNKNVKADEDLEQIIEIECIDVMYINDGTEKQGYAHGFRNDKHQTNQSTPRRIINKRVPYRSVAIGDPNGWWTWDDWLKLDPFPSNLEDIDREARNFNSFMVMEFPDVYYTNEQQGPDQQGKAWKLLNKNQDPARIFANSNKKDETLMPPLRLDPFQYVINIHWKKTLDLGVGIGTGGDFSARFDPTLSSNGSLEAIPGWDTGNVIPHEGDPAGDFGTWHEDWPPPPESQPPWVDVSFYDYWLGMTVGDVLSAPIIFATYQGGSISFQTNNPFNPPTNQFTADGWTPGQLIGNDFSDPISLVHGQYSFLYTELIGNADVSGTTIKAEFTPQGLDGGYAWFTGGNPNAPGSLLDWFRECTGKVTIDTKTASFAGATITRIKNGAKWKVRSVVLQQPFRNTAAGQSFFAGGAGCIVRFQ